jgi:ribosomal protein S27E
MGLLTKEVEVGLCSQMIKYYEDKGYEIPRRKANYGDITTPKGTKIKVKVEDLLDGSNSAKVDVQCDECGKVLIGIAYNSYKKYVHEDNKYYCQKCAIKIFGMAKRDKIRLQKIGSIVETHSHLVKYFVNIEDTYNYSAGSGKKVLLKCPDCGHEKEMEIHTLSNQGFSCSQCGIHYSYSERFMSNFLNQLNIKLKKEKIFDWSNKKKYDFYIQNLNMIIEIHGLQHYGRGFYEIGGRTLEEEQENDYAKEQLAIQNNIEYYIILDCRESNLEWIKNSIMQSKLPILLNFKEDKIDWLKCHEFAISNLVKQACDLWNNGMKNLQDIANELNLCRNTIIKYLKQGAKLNWCNYNPKKEKIKKDKRKIKKIIICLNTNEVFQCITKAAQYYNINRNHIGTCCNNGRKSAGKHPETGEKLRWMYYEDYLIMQQNNQIQTQQEFKEVI